LFTHQRREDALQVDAQSVRALAVFVDEVLGNKHKEGLSVFGLLNQTKTRQGSRLLRAWLTHPTRHMPTLQRRLDHVEYFARPDSDGLTSELRCHLRTLRDVHLVLRHFENMRARINDWSGLQESIQAVLSLQALCARAVRRDGPSQRLPQPPALLDEIARLGVGPLARLLEMVQATIDMDASRIASVRMCVRPGVHAELDQLKASFEGLDDFLTELASRDMREGNVPEVVERMSYAYLPQLGYFAKIPSATAAAPSPPIPGFEFQFAADGHLMFKNARARELDESLGDVQAIIEDSEAAIVRELVQRVLAQAGALRACAAKLHELDVLLSLAAVAAERGFARPELGSAQLRIVEGRHPLQEFCADRFIPNDTQLGGGAARIHLVTGPNNSGKSVYLKQVALVCYMAHVGSFVPARAAEVPLLEHIFTRMLNVDSVASPLSTFSNDAVQVAFALRHCSRASLVLIDEFGKGTGSFDGMALLAATCGFFEARQQASPLALVATHFHELFDARMLRESPLTEFWTMDIAQQRQHRVPQGESVGDDDDPSAEIVFLFKLKRGLAHRSFGLHCARLAGLQPQVLERAAQVASLVRSGRPVTAAFSVSREEAERRARIVDTFWRLDLERNEPDLAPLLQLLRGE
jgi:DNA mismatch repair protein MSH5